MIGLAQFGSMTRMSHCNLRLLQEMAKACKPGGRLVLLEHGRSSWEFINRVLDKGADQHKEKWGCLWNKDILGIVRQVR